jgi:membrane-associated phospholipid phosphatase
VSAQRILLLIVVALLAADCAWMSVHHFDVDMASFGMLGGLSVGLTALGIFYDRARNDANLSAMLFGTAFLCAFSPSIDILNYFLLSVAGTRIDHALAHADQALGLNWPSLMLFVYGHPAASVVLKCVYETSLVQIALLLVCLGWSGRPRQIYGLCLTLGVAGIAAIAIWAVFPSFGAASVYHLPPEVWARLGVPADPAYENQIVALLHHDPGLIAPNQLKGLIAFPSFHTVMAVAVAWYAWNIRLLRWPLLVLNLLVIVSTPVEGGHHFVDVFAGLALAAASIALADRIASLPARPSVAAGTIPGAVHA